MQLRPLAANDLDLVAMWMGDKDNYQWLDFGAGLQVLTAPSLAVMSRRDINYLRLFTSEAHDRPIGAVALSNMATAFGSATLWYVLGDKAYAGHGYTRCAVGRLLARGFGELGLTSVNAWAVETNPASVRILQKNGFRLIGRQRRCHLLNGELHDRLLFDLLATEHRP